MSVAAGQFLVFAASQVGTPGPANMVLMAAGARVGLRRALPFVAGVALGKQIVIWPMGFGLLAVQDRAPWLFEGLKWASVAYVLWLAWRIAGTRLAQPDTEAPPPGFAEGLIVHPLNPKAWAMITAGFTTFTDPGTPALQATAVIATCLLLTQALLHPLYTLLGAGIAARLAGTRGERLLMVTLAVLTVASVAYALFGGGRT